MINEVGRLWTSLADYYIRRNLHEKARDVFEEGMTTVVTIVCLSIRWRQGGRRKGVEEDGNEEEEDLRLDVNLSLAEFEKKMLNGFWLHDDKDVDLRLARLEHLMDRRPILANSVLLRQNPHNVEQWHRRVKLFEGNPTKQILTYTEAVRTVDPMKAVGKPHTLWVAFAKLYENHKDIANARVIFDKAVQVNYKTVDNLASLWCEWAEMELRHKNFKGALELMRRATAEPSVEVKRRVAADGNQPVQMKLHKSLRIWTFYVDLEESLGKLESTRAVYERILDLKIATPQIIINYALLLEEHKYFEDAFKRYGKKELERARQLFEDAVQAAPADAKKPLYLQFAKLEEDYGLAKRAMKVYHEATKAVPNHEKLSMYEIYIARAAEIFGIPKTREIYEQAIESGLPDKDVKTMCLKYAELEKSLGEIDRARGVYIFASQFSDPRSDVDFWNKWHEFEVQHGNEDTFREMLRIKRSVSASYSQTHFILPEYMMQKDQRLNMDEAKDKLKQAGVPEDEMAALERQLAPVANGTTTKDDGRGIKVAANHEDIELPDASDSEDDEGVEIAQKEVPSAVFGELANKRKEAEKDEGGDGAAATKDGDSHLGALERIKRLKRGGGLYLPYHPFNW
ncbi:Tetratricopeptide repeat-like superfamily protein [Prunus dulcis]|uniref:Tetratricopeptide repeat-like superfamily protein n=1 Tax=Prunus dulcis TaxID=3755 RepID=A0A4Y1RA03_PRUDU|nr:Tetratricopeptide repeat-like superfamily protein [Prunus dulcis]